MFRHISLLQHLDHYSYSREFDIFVQLDKSPLEGVSGFGEYAVNRKTKVGRKFGTLEDGRKKCQ
ncbi:MAG: hypothetical protein ACYTBP_07895 [Planctomycetota bacterium]